MSQLLVVGSSVLDTVIRVKRFPQPGESVRALQLNQFLGGKGCNQAVAARRLGASVTFAGGVGDDSTALLIRESLAQELITLDLESFSDVPSGSATIFLDESGQNMIAVLLGANQSLTSELAFNMVSRHPHSVLQLQGEIPVEASMEAADISSGYVILNPAPVIELPSEFYPMIQLITPNEHEASALVGFPVDSVDTAYRACEVLLHRGCQQAVVTMGSQGAAFHDGKEFGFVSAPNVQVVDTVGAGDTFNGAVAFAISLGNSLSSACQFAVQVASISVTRLGAQSGMPYWNELTASIQCLLQNRPTEPTLP